MKNIIICFFSLVFCLPMYGQFNAKRYHKIAQDMAQRKLLVILEEPRTDLKAVQKVLKKHPERIESYQKQVDAYNKELKIMMQKYWKLHALEDIEFITWREMEERQKTGGAEYAVLAGSSMMNSERSIYHSNHIDNFYDYKVKEKKNRVDTIGATRFSLNIDFLEKIKDQSMGARHFRSPPLYITKLLLDINKPNYKNWLYGVTLLNFYHQRFLNQWEFEDILNEAKPRQKRLENKTLVIHEEQIEKKKLSISKIKNLYPYTLEVVNDRTFNQYIASENSKDYAFLIVGDFPAVPSFYNRAFTLHLVIDGSNGDILAISPTSRAKARLGLSQGKFPIASPALPITKEQLEDYTKFIKK